MHANLEQLIALKDGAAPREVSEHVASCPECSAELERLQKVVEGLRSLPPVRPPSDLWPKIRAEMVRERRRKIFRLGAWAAVILAAAGLIGGLLLLGPKEKPGEQKAASPQQAAAPADIKPLISESQRLEGILRSCTRENVVMRGKTASTIAHLEDNIAIVDLQLSLLQGDAPDHDRLKRLWQQRVKLLQALVEVHTSRGGYTQL